MKISRVSSIVVSAVLLVSCGADAPDAASSGAKPPSEGEAAVTTTIATVPPNGESITIQVLDNSYRPSEYEIKAGTEVVFENRGRNDHNILPDTITDDAGLTTLLASDMSPTAWGIASTAFTPGDSYKHLFNVPGVYKFYCSIHGAPGAGMYGTLTVS
ncbi:MAG: plastocyanin/azurin family copper-binding protein [Actinomycetes bacterium]